MVLVGYSIFVVRGELPSSEADQLLQVITLDATGHEATANRGNSVTSSTSSSSSTEHQSSVDESFDLELATAISASLAGVAVCIYLCIGMSTRP